MTEKVTQPPIIRRYEQALKAVYAGVVQGTSLDGNEVPDPLRTYLTACASGMVEQRLRECRESIAALPANSQQGAKGNSYETKLRKQLTQIISPFVGDDKDTCTSVVDRLMGLTAQNRNFQSLKLYYNTIKGMLTALPTALPADFHDAGTEHMIWSTAGGAEETPPRLPENIAEAYATLFNEAINTWAPEQRLARRSGEASPLAEAPSGENFHKREDRSGSYPPPLTPRGPGEVIGFTERYPPKAATTATPTAEKPAPTNPGIAAIQRLTSAPPEEGHLASMLARAAANDPDKPRGGRS